MKNRYNLTNSIDTDLDIKSEFVYNYYNPQENIIDDSTINNNKVDLKSFIDLDINLKVKYDRRTIEHTSFVNENIISYLEELNEASLKVSDLDLFNKLSEERNYLNYLNVDYNDEIIDKNSKEYNINNELFENAIDFLKINKKITINRKHLEESSLYLKNVSSEINNFENFFRQNVESLNEEKEKIHISEKYNVFIQNTLNTLSSNFKFYFSYVGNLIEKYKIFDDKTQELKDSKFFLTKELLSTISSTRELESIKTTNLNIKDNAVRYGQKYQYVIYPVYAITLPKKENYYLTETFLICDIPQFTKALECIETKRPASPTNVTYKLLKNNTLKIDWASSLEEQGDVKGYQIFKRNKISEPYTLIHQIEFFNQQDNPQVNKRISDSIKEIVSKEKTSYIDIDFSLRNIQIYAICAIDARGFTSNYSEQIAIYYDHNLKNLEFDLISKSGAPLHMPNLLLSRKTRFFDNDDKIVTSTPFERDISKFTLYATPETHSLILGENRDEVQVLGNNYKFSIFKIENADKVINDIKILNFTKPN